MSKTKKISMYDTFKTDSSMEKDGIWLDYGDFRVKVGYAGGANTAYTKLAEKKFKPMRRAIETGAISNTRQEAILSEIYAESIVFNWQVKDDNDEWKDGIEDPMGGLMEVTAENVTETLKALPHLFRDIVVQVESIANFRVVDLENDAKN
jgi:hypothetical protein